ncbi:hypothetical protein AC578_3510 [Pseudocercospora eumusae]|uniref:Uncharacterized protein n=1 Tax=Pseudocercospora eumusae TaxID=321146 RepID=A0A139H9Q2_9PEZI|nr:hypothetical protein AC578_3510 [Pseudocercospora eumusae]
MADGTFYEELLPSAIKHEHESLYTQKPSPRSAIKHSPRYLYDRCTSKELRAFVRARGLEDPYPRGLTLKYTYVRLLELADRSPAAFRFLDLPPEVRKLVYKELLGRLAPAKNYTQILRTCQLLCREATDVLYSSSPALCLIQTDETFPADRNYLTVHVLHHKFHKQEARHGQPIAYDALWPAFLTRIRHIRLSIHLHGRTEEAGHLKFSIGLRFMKIALKRLSMLLADKHEVKKLEISFMMHPAPKASIKDEDVRQAMSPLRQLRELKTFTLVGDVPEGLSDSISQTVTSTD